MDEVREEREELAALDREVEGLRREQEAEERWAVGEQETGWRSEVQMTNDPTGGYKAWTR